MKILEYLSEVNGIVVKPYNVDITNVILKSFIVLKKYVINNKQLSNKELNNINLSFVNGLDIFAETIISEEKTNVVFGANLSLMLDFIYLKKDNTKKKQDEYFNKAQLGLISLLISQKKIANCELDGAAYFVNLYLDEYYKYSESFITFNYKLTKKNYINKIIKYFFILAHEVGHIIYKKGKLKIEVSAVEKYLTPDLFKNNEFLLSTIYMNDFIDEWYPNTEKNSQQSFIDVIYSDGEFENKANFNLIINNEKLREELSCDFFALRFLSRLFNKKYLFDAYKELTEFQASLTLIERLFINKSTSNSFKPFSESYYRHLIGVEIINNIYNLKRIDVSLGDKLFNTDIGVLNLKYRNSSEQIEFYKLQIPDFFKKNKEYKEMLEHLWSECDLTMNEYRKNIYNL